MKREVYVISLLITIIIIELFLFINYILNLFLYNNSHAQVIIQTSTFCHLFSKELFLVLAYEFIICFMVCVFFSLKLKFHHTYTNANVSRRTVLLCLLILTSWVILFFHTEYTVIPIPLAGIQLYI